MTFTSNMIGKLVFPAAALTLSMFGLAAETGAQSAKDEAGDLPLQCEIAVSKTRYGHTYEGRIIAKSTVTGTYELNISKRGAGGTSMISQAGDFRVVAGKTETLGQATFGGLPPSAVNAELILHWKGHELACSNEQDI